MSILLPLLAALALNAPADRAFSAPADHFDVLEYDKQPLWQLMARCAKGKFEDVAASEAKPVTASETARAETYGKTVAEMRDEANARNSAQSIRYLTIAIETFAEDRALEVEEASEFVREQAAQMDSIKTSSFSDPCIGIANLVRPS